MRIDPLGSAVRQPIDSADRSTETPDSHDLIPVRVYDKYSVGPSIQPMRIDPLGSGAGQTIETELSTETMRVEGTDLSTETPDKLVCYRRTISASTA